MSAHRRLRLSRLDDRIAPAIVAWDGEGGDNLWSTAKNWSNDALPGPADDVTISNVLFANVEFTGVGYAGGNATVQSLALSDPLLLTGGTLTVTGALAVDAGKSLTTQGAGVVFQANGATTMDRASAFASAGSNILLPGLTTYTNGVSLSTAFEANSAVINLINLNSVIGATGGQFVSFRALAGGTVSLPSVAKLETGNVELRAEGAGSQVNASSLVAFEVPATSIGNVVALSGGQVAVNAGLTTLDRVNLRLDAVTGYPIQNLTAFRRGTATLSGFSFVNASINDLSESSVVALNGGKFTFQGVAAISAGSTGEVILRADGANSELHFPNVSAISSSPSVAVRLRALNGGLIDFPGVVALDTGHTEVTANGMSSQVQLPSLAKYSLPIAATGTLTSTNGGQVTVSVGLTQLGRVALTVDALSAFPTSQLTSLTNGSATVLSGTPNFASVLDFSGSSAIVSGGGTLALPGVTATSPSATGEQLFQASGVGSKLEFANVATMTASNSFVTRLQALSGGMVSAPLITQLTVGRFALVANGVGSVVNLPALNTFVGPATALNTLSATGGGKVIVAAGLTTLERVNLTFDAAASFPASQFTAITNGSITVVGAQPDFANLTNINGSSVAANAGAKVNLSGVTSLAAGSTADLIFDANGASSELRFPNLVTVTGTMPIYSRFRGLAGGTLDVPNVATLNTGNFDLRADGTNSLVNFPTLSTYVAPTDALSLLTARNGGKLVIAPALTVLDRVDLDMDDAANFPAAQLTVVTRGTISVTAGVVEFTSLVNFDETSVAIFAGAQVSFPGITSYTLGNANKSFSASGAGSMLTISNLKTLAGNNTRKIMIDPSGGGKVQLPALMSFTTGNVAVSISGTGTSVIAPALSLIAPAIGGLAEIDVSAGGTFDSADALTLVNTSMTFDTTSNFDFVSLDVNSGSDVSGNGTLDGVVTNNGGEFNPGASPGSITVAGNFSQASAGTINIELGGTNPSVTYDLLTVTGTATLGGALNISLVNGFLPTVGMQFQPFIYGSRVGTFASFAGLDLGSGLKLVPSYLANALDLVVVAAPSKLASIAVNNGANQRSMVTNIKVGFDQRLSFVGSPAAAFSVTRQVSNTPVTLAASTDDSGPGTVVTLTFVGGAVDLAGSLADGRYTLTINANQFAGGGFDGNGDGVAGDNFVEVGAPGFGSRLFRLFGDADGNGTIGIADFVAFRSAFGGASTVFDFDGLGGVGTSDFTQFRLRFGASV